jgi:3-hydroxybutyryl-CoA dehydrogenase
MTKAFLIGDNEQLVSELSSLIKDKCEISDELTDEVDIVFELTNFGDEMKFKIIDFIEEKNAKATIVSASLCITALKQCEALKDPERLVGGAFYPGFAAASAVELSRTSFTNDNRFAEARQLFESCGKEVIESPDRPGMTAMRIVTMIINEAYLVLQEGTSNAKDIDTAMKLGTNYPLGPIAWSEKLGPEFVYAVLKSMHNEFGEDRYRITPLLKEKSIERSIGH